jgi:hypothetical protein
MEGTMGELLKVFFCPIRVLSDSQDRDGCLVLVNEDLAGVLVRLSADHGTDLGRARAGTDPIRIHGLVPHHLSGDHDRTRQLIAVLEGLWLRKKDVAYRNLTLEENEPSPGCNGGGKAGFAAPSANRRGISASPSWQAQSR